MDEHKIKGPAKGYVPVFQRTMEGGTTRQPNERETHALTLTIEALNQFFTTFAAPLQAGPPIGVPIEFSTKVGIIPVTISYTPLDEEDEAQ